MTASILPQRAATSMEALARMHLHRREDLIRMASAPGSFDRRLAERREQWRVLREDPAMAELRNALSTSVKPKIAPSPAGMSLGTELDDVVASFAGILTPFELLSDPTVGQCAPDYASQFGVIAAKGVGAPSTFGPTRAKVREAITHELKLLCSMMPKHKGDAVLTEAQQFREVYNAMCGLVVVTWVAESGSLASDIINKAVTYQRSVWHRDVTEAQQRETQPKTDRSLPPQQNPPATPSDVASLPSPAASETIVLCVQRWGRGLLARCQLHRLKEDQEVRSTNRALGALFSTVASRFAARRAASLAFITTAADCELRQRAIDQYWEHEDEEFTKQWKAWEAKMRHFYLRECPIDATEWAVDSTRKAAGKLDYFLNLRTGRYQEEHPNTNKIIAARNREQLKAQRAREERRSAARQEEAAIDAIWTTVAMPAWSGLR